MKNSLKVIILFFVLIIGGCSNEIINSNPVVSEPSIIDGFQHYTNLNIIEIAEIKNGTTNIGGRASFSYSHPGSGRGVDTTSFLTPSSYRIEGNDTITTLYYNISYAAIWNNPQAVSDAGYWFAKSRVGSGVYLYDLHRFNSNLGNYNPADITNVTLPPNEYIKVYYGITYATGDDKYFLDY